MDKLKPCPFCGGEAVLAYSENYCANGKDLLNQILVACTKCNAVMEGGYQYNNRLFNKSAKKQVISLWNTRAGE